MVSSTPLQRASQAVKEERLIATVPTMQGLAPALAGLSPRPDSASGHLRCILVRGDPDAVSAAQRVAPKSSNGARLSHKKQYNTPLQSLEPLLLAPMLRPGNAIHAL